MFDDTDPRLTGDQIRWLDGNAHRGDVVLTGVVHDHPASTYRARAVVEAVDPAVLALELPPLALPLFEQYAADDQSPPAAGGEMSAAIQAARTDTIVGIDGPTPAFLRRLAETLRREDAPISAVRPLLRGLLAVTAHAMSCRIAASAPSWAAARLPVDTAVAYDCELTDAPTRQAADEQAQLRRAETVVNVFGRSGAGRVRDAARDAHMADQLAGLRTSGSVVAVVGIGHLDRVAQRLERAR